MWIFIMFVYAKTLLANKTILKSEEKLNRFKWKVTERNEQMQKPKILHTF
jgi:hypothetical protein